MLASITPLGERGRNRRWGFTASFYVAGSVMGGATRGAILGGIGALVPASVRPSSSAVALILAILLGVAAAVEAHRLRLPIPGPARQVNEDWLDQYRGWVIGFGFGYQLGIAAVVYITSASLWVVFAAELLTFSPTRGMALGALFGLIRAVPLLATYRVRSPQQLRTAHAALSRRAPLAERVVTATCSIAALVMIVAAVA